MLSNTTFLKWWIQLTITVFAVAVITHLSWWEALWNADQTKLSLAILAMFVFATGLTGVMSKNPNRQDLRPLGNYVWFCSEGMITLGMIGTVAGFLMMLGTAFQNLDVSNITQIQGAMKDMAVGMSTALSTTLVGLVCSILTKVQMVILENSWDNGEQTKI